MKIAVTYDRGLIFQHFGHTEMFKIFEVEDGKIMSAKLLETNGSGHGLLATLLSDEKIDVLICGGIGGGAQIALKEAGIRLYGGVSGDADDAVEAFVAGRLNYNPAVECNHHGEHHGEHNCGEHSCGSHGCSH